ncbi:MAG: efflux RND transporter periplasmic adaptor subunit [Bacteroidetes bacterium]|nr:efflux RND transporter periplasmic adaptor subunit [Bacteroidota bacterium]
MPASTGSLPLYAVFLGLLSGLTLTGRKQQPELGTTGDPTKGSVTATVQEDHDKNLVVLESAQAQKAGLALDSLRLLPLSHEILLSGQVEAPPQNLISVSMPMPGLLRSTRLLPGMKVKKGEILAYMEDPAYLQLQEDYWSTRIRAENLGAEVQRQEELLRSGAGNPKTERDTRSDWRTARVQAKAFEEKLRLLGLDITNLSETALVRQVPVRSPVQGFVTKVHHSTGQYIGAGEALYELVDPSDVHLRLNVFEKDLPYLRENQRLKAYTNQQPRVEHPAHILLIGKEFATDRSVEVHCHFDRYDPGLIPGMFMRARLEVLSTETPALPAAAVQYHQGKAYVFEKVSMNRDSGQGQSFLRRPVRVLHQSGDLVWLEFEQPDEAPLKGRLFAIQGAYQLLMMAFNKADED